MTYSGNPQGTSIRTGGLKSHGAGRRKGFTNVGVARCPDMAYVWLHVENAKDDEEYVILHYTPKKALKIAAALIMAARRAEAGP